MAEVDSWLAAKEVEDKQKEAAKVVPLQPAPYKGKAAPAPQAFNLVPIGSLELTEPEFLIDGLIETETLSLLFGDPGCGKTFLALDLAGCTAAGIPFHGREVMHGPVVYMAGEGHNGIIRRFMAWAKENGIEDPASLPFFKSERAANFLDGATMQAVSAACDAVAASHGQPRLIVVDTVARSFGSGDENSTQDMGTFICAVDDLRARYPGATILLVHHTGHGDKSRARGAMALKGALDAEYRIERSNGVVSMTATKMKDAPEPEEIGFELVDVPLGTDKKGNPFGSAVLRQADVPTKKGKLNANQRIAIESFKMAAHEKGVRDDGGFRGVYLEDWREYFYRKHPGENTDSKRRAFNRERQNQDLFDVNHDLYILKGHGVEDLL
ncbi:AAA family ATPase [Salipiger mangrovisoli]|uniref:AAA family ATPase n=1 Tax=Salipiger mangrovisoli TaxID=2865933 RepID=A0ABR9WZ36_9RHOB|nr:AAA family ATPase [Salipiger mangrovisoli]MBE9636542.1 AAA family ATPase [Salipiger mangrovisoli]